MPPPTSQPTSLPRLRWRWLLVAAGGVFLLVVFQDILDASRRDSAFYLSESGLFAAFWLLMLPLYPLLRWLCRWGFFRGYPIPVVVAGGVLSTAFVHFLLFPALVYGWSTWMLDSTFPYGRSLNYLVSENLFGCLLGYGLLSVFALWGGATLPRRPVEGSLAPAAPPTLTVKSGGQTTLLPIAELRYAVAEKPYVALHTADRKYLVSDSLNELTERLAPHGFLRVHKSAVVRLSAVSAYVSRRNGDYDLALEGGRTLRLSRHYRDDFFAAVTADTGGQTGYTGQPTQAAGQ
ncbi:two-component system LytT family response regulator [Lewinella marina]|uniref:HTH LytTR-type domain-containing protein n=1 Tax=Neolewinella marina TaxID=438751 RepID=A0A2G0CAZ6_9BACT|nr:LytTR family DNA-binding domain-containing protein [Neolewinella marina]NJB85859.1 two-component system LytT family response regulator [Neolewinella marina]PHK97097.1 hypothetical protein CGL56_17615 [Neolewinella marina]